jgi:Fe-S cluster assembly protein SufD
VRGGPFAVVNGAMAADALVVALPTGMSITRPLHIVNVSTAGAAGGSSGEGRTLAASAPRLLICLGKGAAVEVIEEYVSAGGCDTAVFAVAEVVLGTEAMLKHGYVQREAAGSVHLKSTLVDQAEGSSYSLVEARVGGGLSRHDVGVAQGGPETETRMRHFLLAGASQLQDLHSKLVLDHPRGEADQLHKCIVSHASGRGVFDGNVKVRAGGGPAGGVGGREGACSAGRVGACVGRSRMRRPRLLLTCHPSPCGPAPEPPKVNRMAQKTDAGQLSRNLLLVPRATVNVKPNLQIIADDVKCTHGAAISDLSEEELFYFRWGPW